MRACRIRDLGHEVRLLPPAYFKPFVQRNKTDARDARAIAVAATRPDMPRVPVKSVAQQCARSLHTVHDLLAAELPRTVRAILTTGEAYDAAHRRGQAGLRRPAAA